MEAGESGARQSAPSSSSFSIIRSKAYTHGHGHHGHHEASSSSSSNNISSNNNNNSSNKHNNNNGPGPLHEPPTSAMAAATLLNPATAYHHPHSQVFTSPYHQAQHPPPAPMIPLAESKRLSNEVEIGSRQSLPSISEVLSTTKPSHYAPTTPTSLAGSQSLPPPPFVGVPPQPRSESGPESRPLPPTHDEKFYRYSARHDSVPSQGSQSSYSYPEHRETVKVSDPSPSNSHVNSQPPPIPYPPGQLPLSAASAPSRHRALPPYDAHRPAAPPSRADEDYGMHRPRYDTTLNRHFEAWGYSDCLGKIAWNANTIRNFAEAYIKVASEQHGGHPIPERLPTEKEVSDLIDVSMWLKSQLENVRDIVQHSLAEKARDSRNNGPSYDGDDDVSMYGDNVKPSSFGMGEVKKRRGRAAPPGRCHSCNRIDTPEWRRGPDGARTLCNACGLHYAKLERKRQMEQRSIRPKAVEERT